MRTINHSFWAILVLTSMLSACAIAPGMKMGDGDESNWYPNEKEKESGQSGYVLEVKPITPNLIDNMRRERIAHANGVGRELGELNYSYKIGPSDILQITVWDHPELTIPAGSFRDPEDSGQLIGEDGILFYPFIGELYVTGMTVGELRDVLTVKLGTYIQNPQLDVRVVAYRSKRVYVVGEVNKPGILPLTDIPMAIVDAINQSGGLTQEADRGGVNLTRGGEVYDVDLKALYEAGDVSQNLYLQHLDILNVRDLSQQKVFLIGEINNPGSVFIEKGRLTLAAAIGEAGGPKQISADTSRIYVIRNKDEESPQIFHLDAKYASGMLLAEQFELAAQDVIFIDTAGISQWARVINQLLPTARVIDIADGI